MAQVISEMVTDDGIAFSLRSRLVDAITIPQFGSPTHIEAAELVGDDGRRAAVILEPAARGGPGWNEDNFRDAVRAVLAHLAYEGSESYTITWDPSAAPVEERQ